jgi:hypothetical protein
MAVPTDIHADVWSLEAVLRPLLPAVVLPNTVHVVFAGRTSGPRADVPAGPPGVRAEAGPKGPARSRGTAPQIRDSGSLCGK